MADTHGYYPNGNAIWIEDGLYAYEAIFWKKYDVLNKKDSTCVEEGHTGNLYDSETSVLIMNGRTIPAMGHDPVKNRGCPGNE